MWSVRLVVESPFARSLGSSLASEEIVNYEEGMMSFTLKEARAKDARAMWNTRMRSLVVANNMIKIIDLKSNEFEGK